MQTRHLLSGIELCYCCQQCNITRARLLQIVWHTTQVNRAAAGQYRITMNSLALVHVLVGFGYLPLKQSDYSQ